MALKACAEHELGMVWYDKIKLEPSVATGCVDGSTTMVWYGVVWYGTVRYGTVRYGMVWHGMEWYGVV